MYQPSLLRRVWWKYLSLNLPWRRKILVGHDLDGNLFFSLAELQSSGRERRMVKFRVKDDYASYKLPPQWQTWLRHGRDDPPSVHELVTDEIRRRRTRELAARIDEQWKQLPAQADAQRLPIKTSDEALRALGRREMGPGEVLEKLPGKDPGAKFEPSAWKGTIQSRDIGEELKPASTKDAQPRTDSAQNEPSSSSAEKGFQSGEWTGKVGQR